MKDLAKDLQACIDDQASSSKDLGLSCTCGAWRSYVAGASLVAYDGEVIRPNIILCYKFRFETMRICFRGP